MAAAVAAFGAPGGLSPEIPEGLPPDKTNTPDFTTAAAAAPLASGVIIAGQHMLDDVATVAQLVADGWEWPTEEEQTASGTN